MKKLRIPVGVLALALGLGACGETPLLAPAGPSYDSGPTFGTGHRADTTTAITASTELAGPTFGTGHRADATSDITASSTDASRNGSTFGTGY